MIDLTVTCRICEQEHEPDRTAIVHGDWRTCAPCRAAVREHAERAMQRDGYVPPDPGRAGYDALLKAFDAHWQGHVADAERFLTRVHELEGADLA